MTIAKLLGTELPIIQAPMAGAQLSAMAAAVCNAGGLGSLPCAMLSPDGIRKELAALQALTSKPYNLNFFCHTPPAPDEAREAGWRKALGEYYREFGIDPATIAAAPGRSPFSAEALEAVEEFKPAVVSFHFGLPPKEMVARVKKMGSKVMSSATTLDEGRWLEANGADAVIAQGVEAGGHRGLFLTDDLGTQVGTFALVQQLVRALKVPVIAAGGIADANGVRAAMTLGAAGVQVGTAFLLCPEATISAIHRRALQSDVACTTALTNLFTGRPARGIVNRVMREVGPINPGAPEFPLATTAIMPLRAKAEAAGSGDFSPLWSGQNAGGLREMPAAQLVKELARGL